jgi:hypothetical protein
MYLIQNSLTVPSDFDQSIHDINNVLGALVIETCIEHFDKQLE